MATTTPQQQSQPPPSLCDPIRWEYSTRFAIGLTLPLAFALGSFYTSPVRELVPIMFLVFQVLTPHFLGCAVALHPAIAGLSLLSLGGGSLAIYVTIHGNATAGYCAIIAFWAFTVPPFRHIDHKLGPSIGVCFVLLPAYVFIMLQDVMLDGTLYGIGLSAASISDFCTTLPELDINADSVDMVVTSLCQTLVSFDLELLERSGGRACLPWDTWSSALDVLIAAAAPQMQWLADSLSGSELCLEIDKGLQSAFVQVTPGDWILTLLWTHGEDKMAVALQMLYAMLLALSCLAASKLIPPQRRAIQQQQSVLLDQLSKCRASLSTGTPCDPRATVGEFKAASMLGALSVFEFEFAWRQRMKLLHKVKAVHEAITLAHSMARAYRLQEEKPTAEEDAQLREMSIALVRLLDAISAALSVDPHNEYTAGSDGRYQDRAAACAEVAQLARDAAQPRKSTAADPKAGTLAETLKAGHLAAVRSAVDASCSLGEQAAADLLAGRDVKVVAISLVALPLLTLAGPLVVLRFWLAQLPMALTRCCGRTAWWRDYHLYATAQYLATTAGVFAVPVFCKSVRLWLMTPVGPLPTDGNAAWALLPVSLVLMTTVNGALGKGGLRILGTLLGAAFGILAGIAAQLRGPRLQAAVLCTVTAVATFIGANPRVAMASGCTAIFDPRYGYALQLSTYTAMILSLGGADSERYTLRHFITFRLTTQLAGALAAMLVSLLILPRFAIVTAREQSGVAMIKMADALRAAAGLDKARAGKDPVSALLREADASANRAEVLVGETEQLLPHGLPSRHMASIFELQLELAVCARALVGALRSSPVPTPPEGPQRELLVALAELLEVAGRCCKVCAWRPDGAALQSLGAISADGTVPRWYYPPWDEGQREALQASLGRVIGLVQEKATAAARASPPPPWLAAAALMHSAVVRTEGAILGAEER